jgi:CcmD family protein
LKSYAFLFWAYNVIWIGLAAYIALLFARIRRVDRRLVGLERELERAASAQKSSDS